MRVSLIRLLLILPVLDCNGAEEARRKAAENNLKQLELALQNYRQTYDSARVEFPQVIAAETEYYTSGPQQGRPADGRFPKGTRVKSLETAGSYVLVQSSDGVEAYVAADAVGQVEGDQKAAGVAADLAGVVESNNQFAVDLYQQLRTEEGNLFFSPSSISTALAMTYAGAAGETKAAMKKTLHFQLPDARLHEGMRTMQLFWDEPANEHGIRLNKANRLWGKESYQFRPEFLKVTQDKYGAELTELNFDRSEKARRTINDWVEEQTENKITNLIL